MTDLFTSVVSIAATRRRRFLWAAWWTAPPAEEPFRKPDASNGGARSREEARRAAEAAAGRPLSEADPRWAAAWSRVLRGEAAFPPPRVRKGVRKEPQEEAAHRTPTPPREGGAAWAFGVLRLPRDATASDVKKAFRALALETHPDRAGPGATDAAFIRAKLAHDAALASVTSRRKKRR
jgi:hypothetical protein